ncbi:MAG: S9 family peptidase, partial [Candidatus Paceibacterota bacterium]
MGKCIALFFALAVFLSLNSQVLGAEIQYGQVEDIYDSKVHINYKGPWGEENFVCDVADDDCESYGTSTPDLFPEIEGSTDYSKSHSGIYGITKEEVEVENGTTTYLHKIYDVSGSEAELVQLVPYFKDVSAYRFAWAGEHVMLFGEDGTVVTYNIETGGLRQMDPEQSDFPMRSLSPYGGYLSAYDHSEEEYRVWDTETGEVLKIPSEKANFIEFSQDEKYAAFVKDPDNYETIYLLDLESSDDEAVVERIFRDDFTVDDYIFFKNDLYIVGNTEEDPYAWVLYRYSLEKGEAEIVAEDVSFESYMQPVGDHGLSFLQIDGKNTNVALYIPEEDEVQILEAVESSPASSKIERSVVSFDRAKGVLYEPTERKRPSDLFIWIHGGPSQQAAFGYHPSLIYAVYDELLERLVESGAYVLKLDYAGSVGHGNELTDDLMHNMGVADRDDVVEATQEMQKRFPIDETYLIGLSYGGYLGPKALVDEPDLFDGVVAVNGVFDWFTLLERDPEDSFYVYFDGLADLEDLEENYHMYKEASVYKNLPDLDDERILLIYGENDEVVPTWQTREFFYQAEIF